ncbi:hypothetical protein WMF37_24730 [Sorangium sp. So ce291]|uniref:hypothetical protein n=1 Tax=Sorangium sp. So ce291 TaxID=3133294 RepID=UPI003F611126
MTLNNKVALAGVSGISGIGPGAALALAAAGANMVVVARHVGGAPPSHGEGGTALARLQALRPAARGL